MRTFETTLRPAGFLLAVVLPPSVFWLLVQLFALTTRDDLAAPWQVIGLVALAQALPLLALAWMLGSTAACTVEPGRLLEHSVWRDRELLLPPDARVELDEGGLVRVRVARRLLRLRPRPDEAEECRAAISEAARASTAGGGA